MQEILDHIDKLKAEWDSLQPINRTDYQRLWGKFRLEWNYNSNHLEGNTLSYGDTKLLLRLGDEFRPGNNSLKDVNEMKAHDVAIEIIRDWASNNDRRLTERDIRELNEIILVKPFYSDAQTPDGQKTRRLITPGQYKAFPNHVVVNGGEIFKYAEPEEVPPLMEELLNWYRRDDSELHPIAKAAFLHYRFVVIHPFDDGNGRVSRLLMNYHLLREGFPPIIIKSADKKNYRYALQQADSGDLEAFAQYIAEQATWSLELAIKAGKGEKIEEKEDLYKEIEIFKKQIKGNEQKLIFRNDRLSQSIYFSRIKPLFDEVKDRISTFEDFYQETRVEEWTKILRESTKPIKTESIINKEFGDTDTLRQFMLSTSYSKPKSTGISRKISCSFKVDLHSDYFSIGIYNDNNLDLHTFSKKKYDESLTKEQMGSLAKIFIKNIFDRIKS